MKKILFIVLSTATSTISFAQNKDVEMVKQLNASFINCSNTKDTATLASVLADDMQLTNPAGQIMNKQQMLHNLATGPKVTDAKVDTASVRLFGNIAIINAVASFVLYNNGKPTPGKTNYMDVYQKRNGRWWAVAAHVTFLN